ncbi:MAG: T9SS type A sorting domain-containing protein [Chitinophagales bacterium]|nr:T9SS type A sorting domain-containing protein [Chitinophagales bacterium]
MYKNFIFPILLAFFFLSASAQRYSDFSIRLIEPVTTDTVYTDIQFTIKASIRNNGVDTFFMTDSLAFELSFDGSPISFSNGTGFVPYMVLTNKDLWPGDSAGVSFSFTVNKGWKTGPTDICVGVSMLNKVDTILDTVSSNNMSCASITVLDVPVSVNEVKKAIMSVGVYPNPANSIANFSVTLKEPRNVAISLMDITGRVVMTESRNISEKGMISFNTTELPKGMYLYKVQAGSEQAWGKLEVR